jgi:hypothetical protein
MPTLAERLANFRQSDDYEGHPRLSTTTNDHPHTDNLSQW